MSNYTIAYGKDTESLEDPDQLVLVTCPSDWADLESDELIGKISDHWAALDVQNLVGIQDVFDSLKLIIPTTPGIHPSNISATTKFILDALFDALDNNL